MNRTDRQAWKTCRTLGEVGQMTAYWLRGDLTETPGHMGPPCDETKPHADVLWFANFAGFVTTNSQSADTWNGRAWNAWVDGFIADDDLPALLAVLSPGLRVTYCCRGKVHAGHARRGWCSWLPPFLPPCPGAWEKDFYIGRCPGAADEIDVAWFVGVEDPEPGRNDRLWPALAAFAGMAPGPEVQA